MKSIRYGNGSYRVEAILKHTRDEYVANNPGKLFKDMPERNVKAKLGELWDMARAAVPVEVEAAPVVEESSDTKNGGKPAKPAKPSKPAGGGDSAE